MSNEEKKLPPPSHHLEDCIVIRVPPGIKKADIEQQIHEALAEQPVDIFTKRRSRELVIVVQEEGERGHSKQIK